MTYFCGKDNGTRMALSKNKIKFIHSLELKKNRKAEKAFLAEGHKLVGDLLGHFHCRLLVATDEWFASNGGVQTAAIDETVTVSEEDLSRASLLKTPQQVLAVFDQPEYPTDPSVIGRSLCLALDGVQDPGNLGTIVRLADWFGIEDVFCSPQTADIYNPKAMQATMGGIAHVRLHYTPLPDLIRELEKDTPVYGTFLDGENMYGETLSKNGLIVMGNEGNGISPEVGSLINRRLYIPNYPTGRETSESLNVAIATAVVCAEFRRQAPSL